MYKLKKNLAIIVLITLLFLPILALAQPVLQLAQEDIFSTELCDCGLINGKWQGGKVRDSTYFIPFNRKIKKTKKAIKSTDGNRQAILKAKLNKQKRKNRRFNKACQDAVKIQGVPSPLPIPTEVPPYFTPTPPPILSPTPNNSQPVLSPNEPWSIAYKGYNFRIVKTENFDKQTVVYAEISNQGQLSESRKLYSYESLLTDSQGNRFKGKEIIVGDKRLYSVDINLPPNTPTKIGFVFENITNGSSLIYFSFDLDDIKVEFNNIAIPTDREISKTQNDLTSTSKIDSDFATKVLKYTNYDKETIVEVEIINLTPNKINRRLYSYEVEANDEKGNRYDADFIISGTNRYFNLDLTLPPNLPVRLGFVFPSFSSIIKIPYLGFKIEGPPEDFSNFYNIPANLNETITPTSQLGEVTTNSKPGFEFKVLDVFNNSSETIGYVEIISTLVATSRSIYSYNILITDELGNRFTADRIIVGTDRYSSSRIDLPLNSPVRIGLVFPNISNGKKLIYLGLKLDGVPEVTGDFVNIPVR
jgi:hypothetical protein